MKRPIFLIHGWAMPPAIWHAVRDRLQPLGFDVTLAALPGYDSQNDFSGPMSEAIDALFQQSPAGAHWCGWSLGATLCLKAASMAQDRIGSMTLVSPTARFVTNEGWPHGVPRKNFERLFRLMKRDFHRGWRQFLGMQFFQPEETIGSSDEASQANGDTSRPQFVESMANRFPGFELSTNVLRAGMDWLLESDLRDDTDPVQIPTQILAANHDQIVPLAASKWLHSQLADSTLETRSSGHALPITDADWVSSCLAQFVSPQTAPHSPVRGER